MIWKEFSNCLNRLIKIFAIPALLLVPVSISAQSSFVQKDFSLLQHRIQDYPVDYSSFQTDYMRFMRKDQAGEREEYPEPSSVLYRSMIIPGWGQVTNRQIWKVPLIYGLFAGVGYYSYTISVQYRGYKAAYYNATRGADSDKRFGETPDFVPEGLSTQQLRETRDNLRNRRDFSYVIMVMAYGLNILDAYVFAHMRSFDVSDDLSANTHIGPGILDQGTPGVHVRVSLQRK
jgi:hypothetical protein